MQQGHPRNQFCVLITSWLNSLGLAEYGEHFRRYQFVEDIVSLTEGDIRQLGIRNGSHRARIVSSLVMLKNKLSLGSGGQEGSQSNTMNKISGYSGFDHSTKSSPGSGCISGLSMHSQSQRGQSSQEKGQSSLSEHHAEMRNLHELSSMGWYHGEIPRSKAEALVRQNGDFLVRDSSSQPGDFVLTTWWHNSSLHFVINKQLKLNADGQLAVLYLFEEDCFESVTALVHHYMDQRRLISKSSGAKISYPVTRNVPVDYYDIPKRISTGNQKNIQQQSGSQSANVTPSQSPTVIRKNRHVRGGSQPLLSLASDDHNAYEDLQVPNPVRHGSFQISGGSFSGGRFQNKIINIEIDNPLNHRTGSEPDLTPLLKKCNRDTLFPPQSSLNKSRALTGSDGELSKHPPPKPSRTPTVKKGSFDKPKVAIRRPDLYEDDGKDYTDYDQVKSWAEILHERNEFKKGVDQAPESAEEKERTVETDDYDIPMPNPKLVSQSHIHNVPYNSTQSFHKEGQQRNHFLPPDSHLSKSHFDVANFSSNILTPENKPLESSALSSLKSLILSANSDVLAQHITWLDLDLLGLSDRYKFNIKDVNRQIRLSIFALPQGEQLRKDLIERSTCLRMFVEVLIMFCNKVEERANMISHWIEVAQALYTFVGNLYSFTAVMAALQSPKVMRLTHTWEFMKKHYSVSLWTYETKLTALSKSLDSASCVLPLQNVSVPHLLPVVQLLERKEADLDQLLPWEISSGVSDLDVILAHLEMARIIMENSMLYLTTSNQMLAYFKPIGDILEIFATETHLRLLWGKKGSSVDEKERHPKFELVLTALSGKAEPNREVLSQ